MDKIPMTAAGVKALEDELKLLKTKERPAVIKAIAEAREHGDLKENAEYHAAKEEQAKVQQRINELEEKLRSARIIEESAVQTGEIRIGATAHLKDVKSGESVVYTLVDVSEADFSQGKISVQSPVAQALLGRKAGEKVTVRLAGGPLEYQVTKVTRG